MFFEQFWKQRSNNNNIVKILLCFTVLLVSIDFGPRFWSNNNNNRNQGGAGQIQLVNALQQPQQQQQGLAKFTSNNNNNNNVDQNKNQTDAICQKIANNNGNDRLKILCVGLFQEKIILITENFYVYELNRSSLSNTIASLYIDSKPVLLDTKWPVLATDSRFTSIRNYIFNSFTMVDPSSEYILFTVQASKHRDLSGVDYDIHNRRVFDGMQYEGTDYQILLSTDLPLTFYSLHKDSVSGGLMIATYKATTQTLTKDSNINKASQFVPLCENGKDQIYIGSDPKVRCKPVLWPVLKGFVDSGHFYLFGSDFVFKFEQSVYTTPNTNVKVGKTLYSGFFKCGGDIPPAKQTKGSTIGIIVAVLLLLLLLLLLVILCLQKKKNDERRRKARHAAAMVPVPVPIPVVASQSKSQVSRSQLSLRSAQSTRSKPMIGMLSRTASQSNSRISAGMTGRSKLSAAHHNNSNQTIANNNNNSKSRTKIFSSSHPKGGTAVAGSYNTASTPASTHPMSPVGGGSVSRTAPTSVGSNQNQKSQPHQQSQQPPPQPPQQQQSRQPSQTKLTQSNVTQSLPKHSVMMQATTIGGAGSIPGTVSHGPSTLGGGGGASGAGGSRASRAITGRSAISKTRN